MLGSIAIIRMYLNGQVIICGKDLNKQRKLSARKIAKQLTIAIPQLR